MLAKYTEIFANFLHGISVPFDLPLEVSGIFGEMVRISEILLSPDFLEILSRNSNNVIPGFSDFLG